MDNQLRYQACKTCQVEFLGRLENLISHKTKCQEMPVHLRNQVPAGGPQDPRPGAPSAVNVRKIDTIFKQSGVSQKSLDDIMTEALISGDIPFRLVHCKISDDSLDHKLKISHSSFSGQILIGIYCLESILHRNSPPSCTFSSCSFAFCPVVKDETWERSMHIIV